MSNVQQIRKSGRFSCVTGEKHWELAHGCICGLFYNVFSLLKAAWTSLWLCSHSVPHSNLCIFLLIFTQCLFIDTVLLLWERSGTIFREKSLQLTSTFRDAAWQAEKKKKEECLHGCARQMMDVTAAVWFPAAKHPFLITCLCTGTLCQLSIIETSTLWSSSMLMRSTPGWSTNLPGGAFPFQTRWSSDAHIKRKEESCKCLCVVELTAAGVCRICRCWFMEKDRMSLRWRCWTVTPSRRWVHCRGVTVCCGTRERDIVKSLSLVY